MNRWLVVLGAVIVQICVGSIYTWSLFNQPLMDKYGWLNNEVYLAYSIAIFVFALITIISGRLQDKIGPRKVSTIGILLYGGGIALSSTANSLIQLYFFYGIIAGAGVGFAYVCPLSTCLKWFPDKKGFITGITVGSFGLGSLAFKSIIEYFIENSGVSVTFLYLGAICTVLGLIGSQFLINPRNNTHRKEGFCENSNNFSVKQMLKTKSFYLLWMILLLGSLSGLMIIGLAKDIGTELAGLDASVAAGAVSVIAIFNAAGRILMGATSDKAGRIKVIRLLFLFIIISLIIMSFIELSYILFFTCVSSIAFSFGGIMAIFPAITSEYYGNKNLGANYGLVFQAYGMGALVGPMIISSIGEFQATFLIAAMLSILGGALTYVVTPPSPSLK
ncbi:OFA family MFS transporter [Proteinivorax tanatarense]|uniref:OFA family MFS transporter n=1 Tax=Proteinivorax tanatarense TaxID=1260629 RepID=A0AAU7VJQ1_9FIRM